MKIYRDPHLFISGFFYEEPVAALPALTHCGEAFCFPGHRLESHRHAAFEFLYLARGTIHWQVGGHGLEQAEGDLVVFYPGEPHRTANPAERETHQLWIGLNLDRLGPEGRRLARQLQRAKVRKLAHCNGVEPVLRAVQRQIMTPQPLQKEALAACLRLLLILIEQQHRGITPGKPNVPNVPYSDPVQKAISYMEGQLDRRIPLPELAAVAMARQVTHFCAQFRRETGTTPAAYHLNLRLMAARREMLETQESLTQIAFSHGFSSSQHFSGKFKAAFGVTPKQWRTTQAAPTRKGR